MRTLIARLNRFLRLPAEERRVLPCLVVMLALARTGVRFAGLPRTRRLVARLSLRPRLEPRRLADLVRMAGMALPGSTLCLPRAIVLEGLLRGADHPAELRIGIAPRDGQERLRAHAWVELGGAAVAEDASAFIPLPVFGTRG
jgi:hypothetical protein